MSMGPTRAFRCSTCSVNWPLNYRSGCPCCGGRVWGLSSTPIQQTEALERISDAADVDAEELPAYRRLTPLQIEHAVQRLHEDLEDWDTAAHLAGNFGKLGRAPEK